MARIRTLLVGLGDFGALHAQAIVDHPDAELTAVVGRRADATEEFARQFGVAAWSIDLHAALREHRPDAVVIASPGSTHLPFTEAALDAGAAVLLEKPVVPTFAEAAGFREMVDRTGGLVIPAHILRFAAPYREVQRRVREGVIGEVRALSFRRHRGVDHDRRFPDVHPAFMTAIHDIDLAVWMAPGALGPVVAHNVPAPGHHQPGAVFAQATLGEAVASFEVAWLLPDGEAEQSLEVFGTRGMLAIDRDFTVRQSTAGGTSTTPFPGFSLDEALATEIDHFIECVRTGTSSDVVTVDEALLGLEIAHRIAGE